MPRVCICSVFSAPRPRAKVLSIGGSGRTCAGAPPRSAIGLTQGGALVRSCAFMRHACASAPACALACAC
eukprot:11244250-Alexandrium_andersonii.AAC.1